MTVVLRDALSVDAGLEVDVGCALYLMSVADLFLSRIYSTRSMSLSLGGISLGSKYLPLPSIGMVSTPSGRLFLPLCAGKALWHLTPK